MIPQHRTLELQPRLGDRKRVGIRARLSWRDSAGALRFAAVAIRDVSDFDAYVECQAPASIALFRLVRLVIDAPGCNVEMLPKALRDGPVLSAVYRVGPYAPATGTPQGYALRLLIEPTKHARSSATSVARIWRSSSLRARPSDAPMPPSVA